MSTEQHTLIFFSLPTHHFFCFCQREKGTKRSDRLFLLYSKNPDSDFILYEKKIMIFHIPIRAWGRELFPLDFMDEALNLLLLSAVFTFKERFVFFVKQAGLINLHWVGPIRPTSRNTAGHKLVFSFFCFVFCRKSRCNESIYLIIGTDTQVSPAALCFRSPAAFLVCKQITVLKQRRSLRLQSFYRKRFCVMLNIIIQTFKNMEYNSFVKNM